MGRRAEHVGPEAGWDAALASGHQVRLGYRRGQSVLVALLSLVLASAGLAMILVEDSLGQRLVGGFVLLFFAACAAVAGHRVVDRGPAAVVSGEGVGAASPAWTVAWQDLRAAFVHRQRGNNLVCLVVDPRWYARHLEGRGRGAHVLAALSLQMYRGLPVVALPSPLAVDEERLASWLDGRATRDPAAPD